MASLLGSLASSMGQAVGRYTDYKINEKRAQEDRQFAIDLDERRAARQKALSEMQLKVTREQSEIARKHDEKMLNRRIEADEDSWNRREQASREAAEAKFRQQQDTATRERVTESGIRLAEQVSKLDAEIRKNTMSTGGIDMGDDGASIAQQVNMEALAAKVNLYLSATDVAINAAGLSADYEATMAAWQKIQSELAAREAEEQKENEPPEWVDPQRAQSIFDQVVTKRSVYGY